MFLTEGMCLDNFFQRLFHRLISLQDLTCANFVWTELEMMRPSNPLHSNLYELLDWISFFVLRINGGLDTSRVSLMRHNETTHSLLHNTLPIWVCSYYNCCSITITYLKLCYYITLIHFFLISSSPSSTSDLLSSSFALSILSVVVVSLHWALQIEASPCLSVCASKGVFFRSWLICTCP